MTEELGVGLRRVPGLDLDAPLPPSDPGLTERIRAEIRREGPMTFARFMELALYDPDAGYYAGRRWRGGGPGREADFLTAPEGHPIFGWALARQVEDVWERLDRPDQFVVREHGAGTGSLAVGVLDGLRRAGSPLLDALRYAAIERSAPRLERFIERVRAAGFGPNLAPAPDAGDGVALPVPGVVLANELLDALPVHLVEGAEPGDPRGPVLERFVGFEPTGWFETDAGAPSTPALAERLAREGIALEPGQIATVCLAIDDVVPEMAASLERGAMLLIDYGSPAAELYVASRGSTLRAYHGHRVHAEPLVAIGRQDLTAHVDLTAVERAAVAAGLEPLGRTTQAAFLANLGLGELLVGLQSRPDTTLEAYLEARSAVARMLDPRATGAFAVLAFGRGLDPSRPLRGFDPARGSPRSESVE